MSSVETVMFYWNEKGSTNAIADRKRQERFEASVASNAGNAVD